MRCIMHLCKYEDVVNHFSFGGGSTSPINIHRIDCVGNESRLIDCDQEVYTHFYCHYSENVAIFCDGEVYIAMYLWECKH